MSAIARNVFGKRGLLGKNIMTGHHKFYHPSLNEYAAPKNMSPLTYGKDSIQAEVLSHCLQHNVPKLGFTEKAITKTLEELGHSSGLLSVLGASNAPSFVHSSPAVLELIKYQLVSKRYALTENITPDTPADQLPSLQDLLLTRLSMDKPISSQLSNLFSQLSMPSQYLFETAIPELHRLADDMIYFSNEQDHHDSAWYAKRLGVSATYAASKIFMAQDKSIDCHETMEFAKDKLHRVMNLGEYYNNAEEYAWYTLMVSVNLVKSQFAKY